MLCKMARNMNGGGPWQSFLFSDFFFNFLLLCYVDNGQFLKNKIGNKDVPSSDRN